MLIIVFTILYNDSRSSNMPMKRLVELKLCYHIIYINRDDDNINDRITSNISMKTHVPRRGPKLKKNTHLFC